jgi:hypothetical protein
MFILETVNGFGFRRFLENWLKKSHKSTETQSVNSLLVIRWLLIEAVVRKFVLE